MDNETGLRNEDVAFAVAKELVGLDSLRQMVVIDGDLSKGLMNAIAHTTDNLSGHLNKYLNLMVYERGLACLMDALEFVGRWQPRGAETAEVNGGSNRPAG